MKELTNIAKENIIGFSTFERKYRDSYDFLNVSVWSLERAMKEAYELGLKEGKKEKKEMTKEEIKQELEQFREEMQERAIERILEEVDNYTIKAMLNSYIPTTKERALFGQLVHIINHINDWL